MSLAATATPQPGCALGLPRLHLAMSWGVSVPLRLCCSRIPAGSGRDAAAAALSDAMGQQAVTCPSPAAGAAGIREGGLGGRDELQRAKFAAFILLGAFIRAPRRDTATALSFLPQQRPK